MTDRSREVPMPLRVLAWPSGEPEELNPYVRLMYAAFKPPAARILAFQPLMRSVPKADILHVHWPEGIFAGTGAALPPIAGAKALRVLATAKRIRRLGGKLVVTAHNAAPHQNLNGWQRRLWKAYYRLFLRQVDHIIALSPNSLTSYRAANRSIENVPATIIAHPNYRGSYPVVSTRAARAAWNIPSGTWLVGMVGSLRRSKNLVEAAEMFIAACGPDEMLFIVGGGGDAETLDALREIAARSGGKILLAIEDLDDARFSAAIAACDVCLINQVSTLNSGTVLAVLSLDRPLVAPAVGALADLATTLDGGWMQLFIPPLTPRRLRVSLDAVRRHTPIGQPDLDRFDPLHLSRTMLNTFESIVRR
jgi:glycosyltransferase involved in cell wall biosynthesis